MNIKDIVERLLDTRPLSDVDNQLLRDEAATALRVLEIELAYLKSITSLPKTFAHLHAAEVKDSYDDYKDLRWDQPDNA